MTDRMADAADFVAGGTVLLEHELALPCFAGRQRFFAIFGEHFLPILWGRLSAKLVGNLAHLGRRIVLQLRGLRRVEHRQPHIVLF